MLHATRSRFTIGFAFVVALAGCNDTGHGPLAPPSPGLGAVPTTPTSLAGGGVLYLRQSPTAPALEKYTVSFWAVRGKDTDVRVNYLPVGRDKPAPFLRFHVSKEALAFGPLGDSLVRKDSVW